jgi:DNA processing protein
VTEAADRSRPALDSTAVAEAVHLSLVPGLGPESWTALMERFETSGAVLRQSASTLETVEHVGAKLAARIATARREIDPEPELLLAAQLGMEIIPRGAAGYPTALEEIPDPPILLYVKGTWLERDSLAVAMVGARHATPYGLRMADRLGTSLARVGYTVVSGLARGIDAAAHRAALKAGGRTIAVLAGGLHTIYPPEHVELAREIANHGCLMSEMPLRYPHLGRLFSRRNRIVSGLCQGVVVVEAARKSGSRVTARHAVEQNREVFAVPGPADSLTSRGCHALIRDGAKLTETVEDILDELDASRLVLPTSASESADGRRHSELTLNPQELLLLSHLDDTPRPIDDLISVTKLSSSHVLATLAVLEMRRYVKRLPGNLFVRAGLGR